MILRVFDYYDSFKCIADLCKDSCCIGWEIDIDEETYAYYEQVSGDFGKKLKKYMVLTEDMEHSFSLEKHGRCPFLNSKNLCDICITLGEEALSEVCTEYPRFAIEYGKVIQKALCLSCEEVGRIVFTHDAPATLVDYEIADYEEAFEVEPEDEAEETQEEEAYFTWMEQLQNELLAILQKREEPLANRIAQYLRLAETAQEYLNKLDENVSFDETRFWNEGKVAAIKEGRLCLELENQIGSYEDFLNRFYIFTQMEVLDEEWVHIKELFEQDFCEENYEKLVHAFLESGDCRDVEYEQLLVYFTFRYFMNAVYNYDLLSYARLAVNFTRVILDMDVIRFHRNGNRYTIEDRIDIARIFSKEVEHSEENVELAREEVLF